MDETYRMLGREHEADLEREAERFRTAALAPRNARRARTLLTIARSVRKLLGAPAGTPASSIPNVRPSKGG